MKVEQVTMTPEKAAFLLSMNVDNRPLRKAGVDTLVRKIERGEWMVTHQGIAISSDGIVLDGQHRLRAIVEANKPVPVLLATGCDSQIFHAIDCGVPRTNSDLTRIDRKIVEMLVGIGNILKPVRKKMTPGEIMQLNTQVGHHCQRLMEYAPSARRGISCAPVRTAAVVLMEEGNQGDYSMILYRSMTRLDFDVMPRVTQIFVKQMMVAGSSGNSATSIFCKAMKALDKSEANAGQCAFTESIRDKTFERVQKIFA